MNEYGPCMNCEGLGYLNKEERTEIPDLCSHCKGKGKLDWIEQIVGVSNNNNRFNIIDKANILKIKKNIENIISNYIFELNESKNITDIYYKIESYMNINKIHKTIYEWQITMISDDNLLIHPDNPDNHTLKIIEVFFQLSKTVRFINIKFAVKNENRTL